MCVIPSLNSLTFSILRSTNVARCEEVFHRLRDWTLTDWGCALAGEAGEACNIIKKLRRGDAVYGEDGALGQKALADELADVVIYCDLLAARAGIDLGKAVVAKFNEVSLKRGATNVL